jgi:hypothetical protein
VTVVAAEPAPIEVVEVTAPAPEPVVAIVDEVVVDAPVLVVTDPFVDVLPIEPVLAAPTLEVELGSVDLGGGAMALADPWALDAPMEIVPDLSMSTDAAGFELVG